MSTTVERSRVGKRLEHTRLSDEQLVLEYQRSGDRDVFTELVRRYEGELYSYLRRYLGDAEMAEDVFQATFLQLHTKCNLFRPGRRLRPWLYAIATNQAIDARRRNRRHQMASLDRIVSSRHDDVARLLDLMSATERGPAEQADVEEGRDWIRRALLELPEPLRAVVTLVYYQGMKYREVASALKIPVGTVKSRMHTAVLKLNEAWQRAYGEERP
jgi:RNA polymerase sigma-70 factor (ECF subfamily)